MPPFRSKPRRERSSKVYHPLHDTESKELDIVESGSLSAEQQLSALRYTLRRTILYLKIVLGLLVAVVLLLATTHLPHATTADRIHDDRHIKSPVPSIGTEQVVFKQDPIYAARPDAESNKAWNKLLPPGRGFVYVPDWESYSLPPGEETPYGMIYSVALFHQMHCLGQLRRFTWMFLDTIVQNDTNSAQRIRYMFSELDHADHLTHCFDYLRQSIACSGDMALEWPRTEPDGRRFAVDGWNIPHVCKDWGQIMEYMDANYFNMSAVDEIAPIGGSSGG